MLSHSIEIPCRNPDTRVPTLISARNLPRYHALTPFSALADALSLTPMATPKMLDTLDTVVYFICMVLFHYRAIDTNNYSMSPLPIFSNLEKIPGKHNLFQVS
jgi:hypothetical protein